jgi:hypothetical protein
MRIINAAVILLVLRENEQTRLNLPHDRAWYERFFFDPRDGIRAYFERVSSGDVLVHGRVFDWVIVNDLNWDMNDTADRGPATELAMRLHEQHGTDFSEYNLVALIVAAPPHPRFDVNEGSSNAYSATGTRHHAILARDGAAFDFMVHEVGHGLKLDHSCGNDPRFKTVYGQPTEYGHPCVMSAASYGGRGANWVPPASGEPRPEYVGRCPNVNAATARALGWIDAYIYDPLADGPRTFDLTSLELARRGVTAPPAVQVTTPGGVFVIEYRGPASWDLGQREPVVIVNHGKGSTADTMHPGTNSATYLGHIAKGFNPSQPGSVVNTGSFAVELADVANDSSSARVRLTPGRVELMPLKLTSKLELSRTVPLGEGSTTFAPGDRLCVSGTWDYQHVGNLQEATFEATWERARATTVFKWEVAGAEITNAAGELSKPRTVVKEATPTLTHVAATRDIKVAYEVESIPKGSRLKLKNRPEDETYQVAAVVRMMDPIAAADAAGSVSFTGAEYVYPPAFYEAEEHCLAELLDPNRFLRQRIVLPWDLWSQLGQPEFERVRSRIAVLEQLQAAGDTEHVSLGLRELARDLGIGIDDIKMVRLSDASSLPEVRLHDEPPALIE